MLNVLVLWSQYTGHCQVFCVHMNYYMLLYMRTIYVHTLIFMHRLLYTVLVIFQMYIHYLYVLLQIYEELICISMAINTECFGNFGTFMCVDCSWTCGLYTTLLNPLRY